jgi:hypothetical protein
MSGNVETCTSSEALVAETRLFARSMFQPIGAWKTNPVPVTVCQ